MLKNISTFLLLLGTLTLTGCAGPAQGASVTGTVTYRQRIALPSDAVLTVSVEDVSRADAPAEVVGQQKIETRGRQVPFSFAVPYDPDKIEENHTYSLRATIKDAGGNLLFTSDTSVPVITRGNPTEDIEIIVIPVGS